MRHEQHRPHDGRGRDDGRQASAGRTGRGSRRQNSRLELRDKLSAPDPMRVFGSVRPREVRSLASPVLEVVVASGTQLVAEDEEVGTFFVIRTGTAELSRGGTAVRSLGAGDCFGEFDPVQAAPQPFTVTAATELKLLVFSSIGIARLCAAIPGAGEQILRSLPAQIYVVAPPDRSRSAAGSSTVIAR